MNACYTIQMCLCVMWSTLEYINKTYFCVLLKVYDDNGGREDEKACRMVSIKKTIFESTNKQQTAQHSTDFVYVQINNCNNHTQKQQHTYEPHQMNKMGK